MARRTTQETIKYLSETQGFELLLEGSGDYNESYAHYKAQGYVAGAWHTGSNEDGTKKFEIWGRPAKTRSSQKPSVKMVNLAIESNFEKMNTKELRSYCQKRQIKGYSKMKKEEMIEALKSAN